MKFSILVVPVLSLATVGTTHPIDYLRSGVRTNVSAPFDAAATANHTLKYERIPTEVQNEAEPEAMKDLTSDLANAVTTAFTDNKRETTTVAGDSHRDFVTSKVVWIVVGSIAAIIVIIAAAGAIFDCGILTIGVCIVCVNWEKLCARRPTKTSKGVRQLELAHLDIQRQSVSYNIEAGNQVDTPL
ncbi:hypothetical protein F4801DRAFT_574159 [Xylaria longipes]|nr:hypothetical protein F4801DRAFT_574159 [Xylaria longipes]RYC58462.1 hypothetical protein CHU98_g7742 [Xylaria longipes]